MRHRPFFLVAAALLGASAVHAQEPTGRVARVNVVGNVLFSSQDILAHVTRLGLFDAPSQILLGLIGRRDASGPPVVKRPGEAAPYTVRLNRPAVPKAVPPGG